MCSRCRGQFSQAIADVESRGYQNDPCLQASGTRTPAANLENLLKSSAGRRCRTSTQVWCGTRHCCSWTREVTWALLVRWVFLRLFPLITSNDSPLPSFLWHGPLSFPIHVVCYWCRRSDFVNAPVPGPWQILAILSAAPPFELHRRSIIVVRALPDNGTHTPPPRLHPKTLP
jgi:hypothetical protein